MKPQNTKHTRSTHLALGTAALLAASALQTEAVMLLGLSGLALLRRRRR